jgi:hypothetical protein
MLSLEQESGMSRHFGWCVAGLALGVLFAPVAKAEERVDVELAISKGLEWLAKSQARDGSWSANGGQYPTALTALSGIALFMEGSTPAQGKYQSNLRKAVEWFKSRTQPNGMIGNPRDPGELTRYMIPHGYGLLFLAIVYDEETDQQCRKVLKPIIERAVDFTAKTQNDKGGWGYVIAQDGGGFDEGCSSVIQLQSLLAVRKAGITVPEKTWRMAIKYFGDGTATDGGVRYSSAQPPAVGSGRPAFAAGAVACALGSGDFSSKEIGLWINYVRKTLPAPDRILIGNNEYHTLYAALAIYALGDEGYGKIRPATPEKERLTWSGFRTGAFPAIVKAQREDGAWPPGTVGPVFTTSVYLIVLQLEKGALLSFQR